MTSHDVTIQTMSHLSAFYEKACKITVFFAYTQIFLLILAFFIHLLINFKGETTYQLTVHKEICIVNTYLQDLFYQPIHGS